MFCEFCKCFSLRTRVYRDVGDKELMYSCKPCSDELYKYEARNVYAKLLMTRLDQTIVSPPLYRKSIFIEYENSNDDISDDIFELDDK